MELTGRHDCRSQQSDHCVDRVSNLNRVEKRLSSPAGSIDGMVTVACHDLYLSMWLTIFEYFFLKFLR